jgi:hypothetical protein
LKSTTSLDENVAIAAVVAQILAVRLAEIIGYLASVRRAERLFCQWLTIDAKLLRTGNESTFQRFHMKASFRHFGA